MCVSLDLARVLARITSVVTIAGPDGAIDLNDPYVRMLPIETLALAAARAQGSGAGIAVTPVDASTVERVGA